MKRHRKLKKCLIILSILILIIICVVAINWIKFSMLLSLSDGPYNIACSQTKVRTYNKIPLVVHQMWKNNIIPKQWKIPQQSWIREISAVHKYKSREAFYVVWNDRKLHTFINESFPWFYETFRSYRYNIQRADAARYFLLYYYGGIYSDLDIGCKPNAVKLILSSLTQDVALMATKPSGVSNDLIISSKKNEFIKYVIQGLKPANTGYILPYLTVMMTTGSVYLTTKYNLYPNKSQIHIVGNDLYGEIMFNHYDGRSWHQLDGQVIWWFYRNRHALCNFLLLSVALCVVLQCIPKVSSLKRNYNKSFLHQQ